MPKNYGFVSVMVLNCLAFYGDTRIEYLKLKYYDLHERAAAAASWRQWSVGYNHTTHPLNFLVVPFFRTSTCNFMYNSNAENTKHNYHHIFELSINYY